MPVYVYICDKCGFKVEKLLPLKDYASKFICVCGNMLKKNYKAMLPAIQYEENDSIDYNLTGHPIRYNSKRGLSKIAKKHGCKLMS